MQRNLSGPQQEKGTEAPTDESERLKPLPVTSRAAQGPFPPELPTKISGPDLSFLNDDQPDQKHLAVAISKEQSDSRHNNQQGFQTDEDASRELNEACFAGENSQHKIRELWKMQGSDENEDGKLATETRRAQFLLDLERAQKEFDYWDERVWQISLARGHRGFYEPYMSGANHTSNVFNGIPTSTLNHAPLQPDPKPKSPPRSEQEPVRYQTREVKRRRDKRESEKELHTSKPSPFVDVHVNPKTRRDVTLHVDMDVNEDLEEELEEFSKLRRIGHFEAAKRYFEDHLESFIDNSYVLDQYSQFLLEISDVHALTKLAREYPPKDVEQAASANWVLVFQ
ncbi:hypothetical protein CGCA056_v009539 [Colletotrichum aenigma]|uniref:uncharacterized protein n=1 Tax=Colletotrichum aenigma TaxID=1215731 RepID=UPI0018724AA7|nr:uncharacterized protein CGCA056_v009539 [Colletotrichum aenigma]KAF5518721.1 hypothetical protein CGCA056_v009539 [Colletotrichum aenigma]